MVKENVEKWMNTVRKASKEIDECIEKVLQFAFLQKELRASRVLGIGYEQQEC